MNIQGGTGTVLPSHRFAQRTMNIQGGTGTVLPSHRFAQRTK